jgi:hypothetical protein
MVEVTPDIARERAHRGAELLDQLVHNWRNKVNTGRLEMNSMFHCILGQLAEDITGNPTALYRDVDRYLNITLNIEIDLYGFDLPPSDGMSRFDEERMKSWEFLLQAWIDEIEGSAQ